MKWKCTADFTAENETVYVVDQIIDNEAYEALTEGEREDFEKVEVQEEVQA